MNCMPELFNVPPANASPLPASPTRAELETPKGIFLLHVRLPPGYTPNATTNKPKQVHAAHQSEGTMLLITTQQQEQDLLWSVTSAPFTSWNYLVESTALEGLDGIVWSMAELSDSVDANTTSLLYNARTPRRVVLLTNQGTHIVELLKTVHFLQQLLVACKGPHHETVKMFFQTQNEREACFTALLIATSDQFRGTDIALWATQAFMLYGGEPCYLSNFQSNRNFNNTSIGQLSTTVVPGRERIPPMFMSTPMLGRLNSSGIGAPYNQPISPSKC